MSKNMSVTTPGEREIAITREFDAPRELVFKAHTVPGIVKSWLWGPDEWPMTKCELDLKPGGALRYEWTNSKTGKLMGVSGEFQEVLPPHMMVHTELFDEDWTEGETVVTSVFDEAGDGGSRTKLTMTILYSGKGARDGALNSGMTDGVARAYDRLDKVLKEGK